MVEEHGLVLCLGIPAVWLSFLAYAVPAVSWAPDSSLLAWMIDTVAGGLSSSSCASTFWVDRRSVPWACLTHPWFSFFLVGSDTVCRGPVFLLPGLPWSDMPVVFVGLLVLLLMVWPTSGYSTLAFLLYGFVSLSSCLLSCSGGCSPVRLVCLHIPLWCRPRYFFLIPL